MPAIGYVTKQSTGGYKGQLKTLSIRADIDLVPNTAKSAGSQPDFRVLTQGVEIGAGWVRKGETSGKDYVTLDIRCVAICKKNRPAQGRRRAIS